MPLADDVPGPGPDGLADVGLGLFERCFHIMPMGQVTGNGRGQGATGAVVVAGVDALVFQCDEAILACLVEDVDTAVSRSVPPLDEDIPAAVFGQVFCALAGIFRGFQAAIEENFGLGEVGGDDPGEGQEVFFHGVDGVSSQELVATLGHHYRVEDDIPRVMGLQPVGDGLDEFRGIKHADLDGVGAHIAEYRR